MRPVHEGQLVDGRLVDASTVAMWGVVVGICMVASGVVFVSLGLLSLNAAETRRSAEVEDSLVISVHSRRYASFLRSETYGVAMDEPTYVSFYLWNLTNAAAVLGGQEMPSVAQMGPYTYEKQSHKVDVEFHKQLGDDPKTKTPAGFQYVSYRVNTSYVFVPGRSNGSETDIVVSLNATYARKLTKYRQYGYAERLIVAEMAQQHLNEYHRHLRQEFIADTKMRGLQYFLPEMMNTVRRESVGPAVLRQRERVDSASLPSNLVRMHAVARTELVPQVLGDVYNDISDRFLPGILQDQLEDARTHALPRVLSNLYTRLKLEGVPFVLQKQFQTQQQRHVPRTLSSLARSIPKLAFPYFIRELYERACLEAVPSILRTIKLEIIARDIDINNVRADVAQNNVVETWRKRMSAGAAGIDFDAWIDDTPTGQPRTGFELRPSSTALEMSREVAYLLLGSKPSNLRFSVVDYDPAATATYPLDNPTETPTGFGIWKQVIAMNKTAITYVINSVNNDVALTSDYITRAQVLFVRDYLMAWAQGVVIQRDRERFWRQNYAKRTSNSDSEPAVDVDIEQQGVQTGFNLKASGASTSGITLAIAQLLWDQTNAVSFTTPNGFSVWYRSVVLGDSSATQTLLNGITGFTSNQVTEVSAWLTTLLSSGVVSRRALRHWTDGTCLSVMKIPRSSCLLYDLEPQIDGIQAGFEMNPSSDPSVVVNQALREMLWDRSESASFLNAVHASDKSTGNGWWLQAVRTESVTEIVNSLSATQTSFTAESATAITTWLRSWATRDLHTWSLLNWWRSSTCWPRDVLSTSPSTDTIATGQATCTAPPPVETDKSPQAVADVAPESPYSTFTKTYGVTEVTCTPDSGSSTFTKKTSVYDITVREYSCDAVATELSDDLDSSDKKMGFEVAPLFTAAQSASRPSLVAASVLWSSANTFSFLHPTGYKQWIVDFAQDPSSQTTLKSAINAEITKQCPTLVVGGPDSAIFNTTLIGTSAGCGAVTDTQLQAIQQWVSKLMDADWIQSSLLDQWRRGSILEAMDIEPYRPGGQRGWELSLGCACELTTAKGTSYAIPRDALSLWDAVAQKASFLSSDGYSLWFQLARATKLNDATTVTSLQTDITTKLGVAKWDAWLDKIAVWLDSWRQNEHLMRDVLGHWLHGTCSTSPPIVSVTTEPAPTTTVENACPPEKDQYVITVKDSLDDLLATASRPGRNKFFDPDVVENSALIKSTKVVDVDEVWKSCKDISASQIEVTVKTRSSKKTYSSCSFLGVLAGKASDIPLIPQEVTFELNRTVSPDYISMELALAVWDILGDWAFTKGTSFLAKWQPAMHHISSLEQLTNDVNAAVPGATPTALHDVIAYLEEWESSSVSTKRVASAWLSSAAPYLDLDTIQEGIQGGFELYPASTWRKFAGSDVLALPKTEQAEYLWGLQQDYSFLNRERTAVDGLPVGFRAWQAIYDGVDFSSERLISKFPPEANTERDATTFHALSAVDRARLLKRMANTTLLSNTQLQGIAEWLMSWAENQLLKDYTLKLWATGVTPRGDRGETLNLALSLRDRQGLKSTPKDDMFSLADADSLQKLPIATLHQLWDVKATGSLVNPTSNVLWCMIDMVKLGRCPHILLQDSGELNTTERTKFISLVEPVLVDLTVSVDSNLTLRAIQYFKARFDLDEDQVLPITAWWRAVPTQSSFFQALQLRVWQSADPPFALNDPLRFGYDLSHVFSPSDTAVSRFATTNDLVLNSAMTNCKIPFDIIFTLWDQQRPSSFLHPDGLSKWLKLAESASPREITSFVAALSAADPVFQTASTAEANADVVCTISAIANWILSRKEHPGTKQLVEGLWTQPTTSTLSPLRYFTTPSRIVSAFPMTQAVDTSDTSVPVMTRVAEFVLDANESFGLHNLTSGFPTWRRLLVSCASSDVSTMKCIPDASTTPQQRQESTQSVVRLLTTRLFNQILIRHPGDDAPSPNDIKQTADHVTTWLLYWLDHAILRDNILQLIGTQVNPALQGKLLSYEELALEQFVHASASQVDYTTPPGPEDKEHDADWNGRVSEHISSQYRVYDDGKQAIIWRNYSHSPGFGEFGAFCSWNRYDLRFSYDATTTCGFGTAYDVSLTEAAATFSTFEDEEEWQIVDSPLKTTRGAVLIDAFLAQPFPSQDDCTFVMNDVAQSLGLTLSSPTVQNACKDTVNGILLDLPALTTAGFATTAFKRIQDFQAYLRYTASRFVYEPSVLNITAAEMRPKLLDSPPLAPTEPLQYPVGGYIAAQSVARVLDPHAQSTSSLWQTEAALSPLKTLQIPAELGFTKLLTNRDRAVGELVAMDGEVSASVLGTRFSFGDWHVSDGSHFVTPIFASRSATFPPPSLTFYWDYAQRFVQLKYLKNVTRFGLPLMRYTIENWQAPITFPSGVGALDANAPTMPLNLSSFLDDLPIVLGSAPPALTTSALEASRENAFDIDALTAMVLHRRMVWQLSSQITNDAVNDWWHQKIKTSWLPVMWVRQQQSVSPTSAGEVYVRVIKSGPFATEKLAMFGVIGGGVYFVVGTALAYVYGKRLRLLRFGKNRQSVMPAVSGSSISSVDTKKPTGDHDFTMQVHATSDVRSPSQSRRKTKPRVETIDEHTENIESDAGVQQL
ncbi:hypothetical protein Poli38472_013054 [Pythium oligandrum]|uniref:Uncharacterized protein n=1 Tax=Pythium oligandrum TaxID=41045 RepID=A0A8K1CJ66_PYTOL|nr:hypothetical protein Poli38472_013054 [Pythium oligandrum]|eukprot:TMW64432.1 hypothetical protein Poli38472_013054 [Pythium oligandrum]